MTMACLDNNMFNPEHNKGGGMCHPPPMSPRISFSNDFIETQSQTNNHDHRNNGPPQSSSMVASDFEFSVSNFSMMPADELFSRGTLLPFKSSSKTTLRDELLVDDDDEASPRPPKGPTKWRQFLGLKKSHKKVDKSDVHMERIDEVNGSIFAYDVMEVSKISQDMLIDREPISRDMEVGI